MAAATILRMADDRSNTGSAATEGAVHDDDELAEVLAAELERYSTGSVPVLPRDSAPAAQEPPLQPLAVPRIDEAPQREPSVPDGSAFSRRAAAFERAIRPPAFDAPVPEPSVPEPVVPEPSVPEWSVQSTAGAGLGTERPTALHGSPGPVMQPTPLPTADDLPVKRRTGFRPPPSAIATPPVEPLDRVLPPTGPVSLPEPTASLLEAMITGAIPTIETPVQRSARHAAPRESQEPVPTPTGDRSATGPAASGGFYEDWEQSLRSIGRPRPPWETDDEIVPTGGDVDVATVALPVQGSRPVPRTDAEPMRRGAHALPEDSGPIRIPDGMLQPRRSGRRRAPAPDEIGPEPPAPPFAVSPQEPVLPPVDDRPEEPDLDVRGAAQRPVPPFGFAEQPFTPQGFTEPSPRPFTEVHDAWLPPEEAPVAGGLFDVDDEGIDEVAVDYPEVSAATTGAVDLPSVEPRPRTAPVLIERVRTALLQLPTVPPSPTGSGAAAVVGRWVGAFASPLVLVLGFGLAAAGAGPGAVVAVLLGALLAVPALVRVAGWSARVADDGAMLETTVLGSRAGRVAAVVLLVARLGTAAAVLLAIGSTAGAWAGRTGALGLGSSSAALLGCTAVGLVAVLCAALPTRATAVLTLVAAVLGAVGTLLIALVLAPTGGTAVAGTGGGGVAAAGAGFAAVGLLLVLIGADVARWRTDLANPVSTAVASAVSAVCGAVMISGSAVIAGRLSGGGAGVDEFAGALSDASASLLAAPMLVILLVSALTLPVLLMRSAGASAARLLGAGRPVRLGAAASGLLALAVALGMLAAGVGTTAAVLAVAGICGVPVAAWAGVLTTGGAARRPSTTAVGLAVAVLVGWALSDGLVPGATSPLLAVLPPSSGLHGGPVVGLAAALLIGAAGGLLGRSSAATGGRAAAGPADTVEG